MPLRYLKNVTTLRYSSEACTGCGMCALVCPHDVFRMNGKKAETTDVNLCMECGACSRNCPSSAIQVRAGVGCAYAIILSALRGKPEPTCGCDCRVDSPSCAARSDD